LIENKAVSMPEKKAETPASKASTTHVKTATGIDIICLDPPERTFPNARNSLCDQRADKQIQRVEE
jgi:hypothetical protein